MTSGTGAARTDHPRQGRREAVLDEASRHLNASGVSQGTLAEIAAGLGINRATLYDYVQDREDLVFQCYGRSCDIMQERLASALDAEQDPFAVISRFIGNVLDPTQPEAAALSEIGCLRPDDQAAIGARREAVVGALARVLEEGQARGRMRGFDTRVAAHAILSLVFWLKLAPRWLAQEASLSRDHLEAAAQTLIFEGVATGQPDIPRDLGGLTRLSERAADVFDRKAVAAAKLDRILAAASRLINQRGVDTTSIEEIAAALGVTKRTIYNHFPDKQALISACLLRGYRIFTEIGQRATAWPGSRAEALAAAFHASVMCSFRPELSPLRVFSGLPTLTAENRARAAGASAELQRIYARMLAAGVSEGSLREIRTPAAQLVLAGVSSWVAASEDTDPEHIASEVTRLVLFGLRQAA